MASKALISSASPLVSIRAPSNPLLVGFGPRIVSFSSSTSAKKPSSRPSLVIRAQQQDISGIHNPSVPAVPHAPWTSTEDDYEVKMRFDMPGIAPEDIDVKLEGNMLIVKDLGRQMYSPYDAKLQLPPYCSKTDVKAILKNGVLHVTVPKIPKFNPTAIHVPVRPSPLA